MSEIVVTRSHALGATQARAAAQRVADRLGAEFDLRHAWNGDILRFVRSGVEGELAVGGERVTLRVKLGFMLSLLKPKIEAEIHRYLQEDFAPTDKVERPL